MNFLRVFLRGRGMGRKWGFCGFLRGFRGFWFLESRFWPLLGAEKPSLGAEKPLNGRVLTSFGAKKPFSSFKFRVSSFEEWEERKWRRMRRRVAGERGMGFSFFFCRFLLGVL
jgi:hypothetical protein